MVVCSVILGGPLIRDNVHGVLAVENLYETARETARYLIPSIRINYSRPMTLERVSQALVTKSEQVVTKLEQWAGTTAALFLLCDAMHGPHVVLTRATQRGRKRVSGGLHVSVEITGCDKSGLSSSRRLISAISFSSLFGSCSVAGCVAEFAPMLLGLVLHLLTSTLKNATRVSVVCNTNEGIVYKASLRTVETEELPNRYPQDRGWQFVSNIRHCWSPFSFLLSDPLILYAGNDRGQAIRETQPREYNR